MRRGQRVVSTILSDDILISSSKSQKGVFKDFRDDTLAHRYYYYDYLCHLKYQTCISRLSIEFHISETVVVQILCRRTDLLRQLKADKADHKYLRERYPYYNWGVITIGE